MNSAFPYSVRTTSRLRPRADGSEEVVSAREAADLSLAAARELLDWLEVNGHHHFNVELTPAGRMTVRWSE